MFVNQNKVLDRKLKLASKFSNREIMLKKCKGLAVYQYYQNSIILLHHSIMILLMDKFIKTLAVHT